ncbi:MAG: hypothetical protein ACLRMW_05390 [[Clostridium] symbiosum]
MTDISLTMPEVDALAEAGADIMPLTAQTEAWGWAEPMGIRGTIKEKYPDQIHGRYLDYQGRGFRRGSGIDLVSTTMSGYTDYTQAGRTGF